MNRSRKAKDPKQEAPPEPARGPAEVPSGPSNGDSALLVRWLLSGTVRQVTAMRKHVLRILNHQRDILTPKAVAEVEAATQQAREAAVRGSGKAELQKQMENLETTANKWLKPYPNATWRENIEVLLVALTVAMGVRTFFLQPFKIPTGSMQPTLYGVTSVPDFGRINFASDDRARVQAQIDQQIKLREDLKFPTGWERIKDWFTGTSYIHVVANRDGALQAVSRPLRFLIFNIRQTLVVGGETYTIWFPPDYGAPPGGTLPARAGLRLGEFFHKGEDIVKLRVHAGDHLFVDRLTYNFRPPKLGEIIVFETRGIDDLPQDQFYIKRLVALPDDRVQIPNDRHLIINGRELEASTPHFGNVLGFNPNDPPRPSQYSGYLNQEVVDHYLPPGRKQIMPLFPDASATYQVRKGHFMVMGDNTMDSYDSRFWGDFPATNVIGRACFVYWPITSRFGAACLFH